MDWTAVILACLCVGLLLVSLIFLDITGKRSQHAPAAWTWPLIGDTLKFIAEPDAFLWRRFCRFGPTFRVHFAGEWLTVISDMDVIRQLSRSEDVQLLVPGSAFGMLIPQRSHILVKAHHSFFRKMMTSSLNTSAQDAMLPQIKAIMDKHVQLWDKQGSFDVFAGAQSVALDLGVKMLSGLHLEDDALSTSVLISKVRTFIDGLYSAPINLPGTALRRAMEAKVAIVDLIWPQKQREVQEFLTKVSNAGLETSSPEAVQSLFASGRYSPMDDATLAAVLPFAPLDQAVVVDRTLSNMIAASDTSRNLFVTSLACIAKCERIQEPLYQEQQRVMREHPGEDLSMRALADMPLLEATIKESVRLIMASHGGFRRVLQDIKVGQYLVPKGSGLWWPHALIHAVDPALWDGQRGGSVPVHMDYRHNFDAAFRPERWLQEDTRPRQYLTFGIGQRMCLGQQLVYLEAKVLVSMLVRRFQLQLQRPDIFQTILSIPQVQPRPGMGMVELIPRLV